MRHTVLCVLGFFSLYCGHAQDAVLTIEPNWSTLFTGESVTFICDMREGEDTDWYYSIWKDGGEFIRSKNYILQPLVIGYSGEYQCFGDHKISPPFRKESNKVSLTVSGESVTLRCRHCTQTEEKNAVFYKDGSPIQIDTNHQPLIISNNTVQVKSDGSSYTCKFEDEESEPIKLKMEPQPKAQLSKDISVEGSVTLTCSVITASSTSSSSSSSDWKYFWYREDKTSGPLTSQDVLLSNETIRVSVGGVYRCRGGRGEPDYYTDYSDPVTVNKKIAGRAVVTLQPNWSEIYRGEKITLRCEIQEGGDTEWTYGWTTTSSNTFPTDKAYTIISATESHSGQYRCLGRRDTYTSTEWSEAITLKVLSNKPRAELSVDNRDIPVGGSVTLTCSVNTASSSSSSSSSSSGWKYFWYREEKTSEPVTTQDVVFLTNGQIRVSVGGVYWCRGGRGQPDYYTEYSDPIAVNKKLANKVVVTLQPNWSEIYKGEKITLRCEITDEGDSEWEYEWRTTSSIKPSNQNEHHIRSAYASHSGTYSCKGRMKGAQQSSTEWSDPITLTVSNNKPQPVLTVSPSWLSPGASVTLSCSVKDPSAGWRFYWYKAVPRLSDISYSYDLLPGSTNGTEQDSYIVDGQTHTAGYVCRAARGDPVFYTHYSELKFVWSGDVHLAASLTVGPDRSQHFNKESLSLSCEGNSTEWRVKRFTEPSTVFSCSIFGKMNGSTCNIDRFWFSGVYWCESETGQISNAVNITIQYGDIILVSPVLPVAEGHSVTLGCRLKTENVLYNVDFYKNGKLIQNNTRGELTISAVSKSHEGFYKCKGNESPGRRSQTSQQSWMSVKPASRPEEISPFPVLLVVGLVGGVLLILLLLLFLYRYRKSNDSCFSRSPSTNQSPATNHMINQEETQHKEYASVLHGDAYLYETIKGPEEPKHDESKDVTYSVVELKNIAKKGRNNEPKESTVYSTVKMASAADDLLYAQVHSHTQAKKDTGPAAADETV
ncbi:Fc receptor-like protein 3 isoform X1 [Perca fluviatilis]|uniref:Fc receptor-like protein 3 isoform X1 n=1 Tax=Perca fluviatilis TaxID=8168 RepID=UPI0019641DAE|nr:Fc receptor-like protein 3 isoform X1 [Perca fluviatilis]